MVLRKLLSESDRLVVSQISKERIKQTRIKHLNGYRSAVESLDEPMRTLGLTHLDNVIALANAVNERNGAAAEILSDRIHANLDAITEAVT